MYLKSLKTINVYKYIILFVLISILGTSSITYSGPAESCITKARKYQSEGKYTMAINEYYKAINKEPAYPYTYNHLGIICEVVLKDYDLSAIFFEKALSLLKFKKTLLSEGLVSTTLIETTKKKQNITQNSFKKFDSIITEIEEKKDKLIEKIFFSIDNPIYPTCIVIKEKKKVYPGPGTYNKAIPSATLEGQREFMFWGLQDNWYHVKVASTGEGWIRWNDINLIYQNKVKPIRLSSWQKATEYEKFTRKYQNSALAEKARDRMDSLYFEIASKSNTLSDYETYLNKCPEGKFVKKATTKIAELNFTHISNNIYKLNRFIKDYPESHLANKALNRIEELTYKRVKASNSVSQLNAYLKTYPDGKFAKEVQVQIKKLEIKAIDMKHFEQVRKQNTINAYKKFVKEYPESDYIAEVHTKIEKLAFENAKKKGTIEAYESYIFNYPNSKLLSQAQQKIDKIQFEPYKSKDTIEAYNEFINNYPRNQYITQASRRIEELQPKKTKIKENGVSKKKPLTDSKEQEITNKLKRLEDFYNKGLIDQNEYMKKKKEILKEL